MKDCKADCYGMVFSIAHNNDETGRFMDYQNNQTDI